MKPANPPKDLFSFLNERWQQARSAGQPQSDESVARDQSLAVRGAEIEKLRQLRLRQHAAPKPARGNARKPAASRAKRDRSA